MKADLAEFHDIGKLLDWKALGLQVCGPDGSPAEKEPHDFEKCKQKAWQIDFSSPVWEACFRKDPAVTSGNYKDSAGWALVSLADELAAGVGRIRDQAVAGSPQYGCYCLWTGRAKADERMRKVSELENLIRYLNGNPAWEEASLRYSPLLHSRAETARPGLNVTTLYSHSVLAGKIFRVLSQLPQAREGTFESYRQAAEALGKCKLTVALVRVIFPQRPFRVRDLFIFQQRRQAIKQVISEYRDNVLVPYGANFVALFSSPGQADGFLNSLLSRGYVALVRGTERTLSEIRDTGIQELLETGRRKERERDRWAALALPDSIEVPLCENCQMAHADRRWPRDFVSKKGDLSAGLPAEDVPEGDRAELAEWPEERAEENLCSRCFDLRAEAEPLRGLAAWQSGDVAWVRIALDLDDLVEALRALHVAHITTSAKQIQSNLLASLPVRFSMLDDFVEAYEQFLARWLAEAERKFGSEFVERVNDDLACVRIDQRRAVLRLLEIHSELMREHFPKLIDLDVSPVRLILCVSSVKHPFFAHWRYLESPDVAVGIQVVGSGSAEIPLNRLDDILRAVGGGERRALIRLREIARTSKKLAELVFADRQDRDSRAFAEIKRIVPLGMDFESLTVIANLAKG